MTVTTLAELADADIDMLTLVIVGSAKTRRWRNAYGAEQVFTPRGYGDT